MKYLFPLLVSVCMSSAFAMPNPTYTALDEAQYVTKYISDNMSEIINTSAELAKTAVPNAHYFLITDKISIFPPNAFSKEINEARSPIATLHMTDNLLECERDIFSKIQYDDWGGKRSQQFNLSQSIRCKLNSSN